MKMRQEVKQKQRISTSLIYKTTAFATVFVVLGAVFMFNIGNVRSALAGKTTTRTWEGKHSSDWNSAKNWKDGKLPKNGDNVAVTNKYKYAPEIKKSAFYVYDLFLSKGAKVTLDGSLVVKDDITVSDSKSAMIMKGGTLAISDHIYLQNGGTFDLSGGTLTVDDDITIEEGKFYQKGAKTVLLTKDGLEFQGGNCYYYLSGGLATITTDLDFESTKSKGKQRLEISGGKIEVKGITRFYKTKAADNTDQMVVVKGGYVTFNEIGRKGNTGTTYPSNFIFEIDGGETHFNEDLIMDQYKGSSSGGSSSGKGKKVGSYDICKELKIKAWHSGTYKRKNTEQIWVTYKKKIYKMKSGVYWSKQHAPDKSPSYWTEYKCQDLCSTSADWDSDKEYKRVKGGDDVYVGYKGKLYMMKSGVWWTKNHLPSQSKSKYWTYVDKCYEWTEEKCGGVAIWNSTTEYKRKSASDKIEVSYDGYVYSLEKKAWYTKNEKPSKHSKVWKKGKKCSGGSSSSGSTTSEDVFTHKNGKVVFHKKWTRPPGFQSKGNGIVHFKNASNTMPLQSGEKYVNLVIDAGVTMDLEGDVEVSGDITNNSSKKPTGSNKIKLTGTGNQSIDGSEKFELQKLEIDKSNGKVYLDQDITITGTLTFTTATGIQAREIGSNKAASEAVMTFEDGATWSGDGWIEGKVRKIGDDAFVFPIGKGGRAANLAMSQPGSSSTFDAEYFNESYSNTTSMGTGLKNVSKNEYWSFERAAGTADVDVTLHWTDGTWSAITDETELLPVEWNGSQWETLGHGSHTGNTSVGSVTGSNNPSSYNLLTFGSNSNLVNALPVELIFFKADRQGEDVVLTWATAEEVNNDFFELHRSTDGSNFEVIGTIMGNGNSLSRKDYTFEDLFAPDVKTYYRLKQVDVGGDFEYKGGIVSVNGIGELEEGLPLTIESVGPNPFRDELTIIYNIGSAGTGQFVLVSTNGNVMHEQFITAVEGTNTLRYSGISLEDGYYILKLVVNGQMATEKVLKTQ